MGYYYVLKINYWLYCRCGARNGVTHRASGAAAHRDSGRRVSEEPLTDSGDLRRENEALRERISPSTRPSCAPARCSTSAPCSPRRSRAPAGSAAPATGPSPLSTRRAPQNYVLSGFTPEQEQEALAWPDHDYLLKRLRELASRGRSPGPTGAIEAAPGPRTSATFPRLKRRGSRIHGRRRGIARTLRLLNLGRVRPGRCRLPEIGTSKREHGHALGSVATRK